MDLGSSGAGPSGVSGVADVEFQRAAGAPTGGAGRGELPPWPSTLEEGEWQVLSLQRSIREIERHLGFSTAASCALTGMTAEEHAEWRVRAEKALAIKTRQHAERALWVRQQRRALGQQRATAGSEGADALLAAVREHFRAVAAITPSTPDADALLARAASQLRAWAQEFEPEEITTTERAVIGLLEDYLSLRRHRAD